MKIHKTLVGVVAALGGVFALGAAPMAQPADVTARTTGASAAVAPPPLTKADADVWLDGFMPFALASGDVAGAVVVVVKDGAILTERGFGYADVAKRLPVDPQNTLFRPGSASKLFTWTAVMQQVQAGK